MGALEEEEVEAAEVGALEEEVEEEVLVAGVMEEEAEVEVMLEEEDTAEEAEGSINDLLTI